MSSLLSGNRRRVLKGAAALGAYALSGPGARAAGKPFEGVELNVSCWSAPFPKLLQGYLPEFEQLTGIKVNYDTPGSSSTTSASISSFPRAARPTTSSTSRSSMSIGGCAPAGSRR